MAEYGTERELGEGCAEESCEDGGCLLVVATSNLCMLQSCKGLDAGNWTWNVRGE
jgi:hypothetical protein